MAPDFNVSFTPVRLTLLLTTLLCGLTGEAAAKFTIGTAALLDIPHNERVSRIVVSNPQVTRYEGFIYSRLAIRNRAWLNFELRTLGVQTWKSVAANGLAAWNAADYAVNGWRTEWEISGFVKLYKDFGIRSEYGRCKWCRVPDGKYFLNAGFGIEHTFGD